ncbi:MAG: 23S rRNA (pseudouridine(1915)-N(3))-methyltransferase RlmH [Acidiferrobacterales bacterium]
MDIQVIAIGQKMPAWVDEACDQYRNRVTGQCSLRFQSLPARKRGKGADISRIIREEGSSLLNAVPSRSHTIALEREGKVIDSKKLATVLDRCLMEGLGLVFLIGGPEGLSDDCQQQADEIWSLSALTLAHPVARVVLAEQIYRAWSMLNNLPYHR